MVVTCKVVFFVVLSETLPMAGNVVGCTASLSSVCCLGPSYYGEFHIIELISI